MNELALRAPGPTRPSPEGLLRAYARAKARYDRELGDRRLVSPDARDFPDPFLGDEPSAGRLLRRMQVHAGMEDIPVALHLIDSGSPADSSCASGACAAPNVPSAADLARVVDEGESWALNVPSAELKHPIFLTTGLARSLALIFLLETEQPGDRGPTPFDLELMAVQLGFGGLLLQGAHVYQKACSGPRIDRFTAFSVEELALLSVTMALDSGSGLGRLPKLVEATQNAALSDARRFLEAYPSFLQLLREDPRRAAEEPLKPAEAKGLWNSLKSRFVAEKELPGSDLAAWQKLLGAAPQEFVSPGSTARGPISANAAGARRQVSEELRDLVKSEL
jgi:hypothetical protein